MATTSPDGIPYVGPTQYADIADFPAADEDQALALQTLITDLRTAIATLGSNTTGAGACPVGTIVAYAGTSAPTGWHLCNGTAHGSAALTLVLGSANAPDLRDRFIVGTGTTYARSSVGGAASVTLTAGQSGLRPHDHVASTNTVSTDHYHSGGTGGMSANASHSHTAFTREGDGTTGDSEWWIDTSNGAQTSPDTVRYNTVVVNATNTDHGHVFNTNMASVTSANYQHGHTVTVSYNTAADAVQAFDNRPPYFGLAYIIKK